jgi:hypothetical protein
VRASAFGSNVRIGRGVPAIFRRTGLALALATAAPSLVIWSSPAGADLPTLSRELTLERYVVGKRELESIRAQRRISLWVAGGAYQRGDDPGEGNPFGSWKRIAGGRADAHATLGRFTLGGEGIADTRRHVEPAEYESRLYATAYMPESRLSLVGALGFEDGDYRGADLTAEALAGRIKLVRKSADIYPRLMAWMRLRKLDHDDRVIATPAAGLVIPHVPVFGSHPYASISIESQLAGERLPLSSLLLQFGWASEARPLWGGGEDPDAPPRRGARAPSDVSWNWFLTLGYAAPLDTRSFARNVAQAGVRLVRPLGSR